MTKNSTRLVLAAMIIAVIFQAFGIAPKDNPVRAQSVQWTYVGQSVPDGTCFIPNTAITVTWTVQLTGTGYGFTFVSGPVSNVSTSLSTGQNVTLTAAFTTPSSVGDFRVDFKIIDANGNTISSTKGSSTLWLTFKVADNCNANNSAPVQNSDNQPATSGGHWIETPEQSHQVCKINTWFGCWWWETVIDVPASKTWVPDPTPIAPAAQPSAPVVPAETQLPVSTAQIAPSGPCNTVGETQVGGTWTVVCLGGNWMQATINQSGNTVVPIEAPTAPAPTPIPNSPSSFNGISLPSTAHNVINGGPVMLYLFAGSMTLPSNYVLVAEGAALETLSATSASVVSVVSACAMPLVIIGVAVLVAYGITALVAVPAAIVHPPAVPAPVAPPYLTLNETASGLIGIPGIVSTSSATIAIEVLQNDSDGCHINVGLTTDYYPDHNPLEENIHETVKHHGPCNKSDIRYLIESLIRQLRQFIDAAKKVLQDPASYSATAEDLAAVKEIIELFPKIVNELIALLSTL